MTAIAVPSMPLEPTAFRAMHDECVQKTLQAARRDWADDERRLWEGRESDVLVRFPFVPE